MKRIILLAVTVVFIFGLCSWSGKAAPKYPENIGSFYGLCESVRDDFLAVYPYKYPQQYNESKRIAWIKIYTDDNTEFYTPDGKRIQRKDLEAGEQAEFYYDTKADFVLNEYKIGSLPCFKVCLTGKFFLVGPAKLTIKSGVNICTTQAGTASWTNSQGDGYSSSFESDTFSHPVNSQLHTLKNDGSGSFELSFDVDVEPQNFSVSAWSGSLRPEEGQKQTDYAEIDAGELKIVPDGYTVTLPANPDGWVIQVRAYWKHGNATDEIYWQGGGLYCFFFTG